MRRSKLYRYAADALDHGRQYAFRDRKRKKQKKKLKALAAANGGVLPAGTVIDVDGEEDAANSDAGEESENENDSEEQPEEKWEGFHVRKSIHSRRHRKAFWRDGRCLGRAARISLQ